VTGTPIEELAAGNVNGRFERVGSNDGIAVWRNRLAYERILTPAVARITPWGEQLDSAQFEGVDFNHTLLLHPEDRVSEDRARQAAASCHGSARVRNVKYGNNYLEFDAVSSSASWVAISDVYFPGWRAWADGEQLTIWRANGAFRALCVPAGARHVRMEFGPLTFIRDAFFARVGLI
jgi:hypothetical protein